jgi:hypothetical protein
VTEDQAKSQVTAHTLSEVLRKVERDIAPQAKKNGNADRSFAPPGNPDRMQQTADLVGETIRAACKSTSKSIRDLVAQAKEQVANMEADAEFFITDMESAGGAHAERIEAVLHGLKGVSEAIAVQRTEVGKMALAAPAAETK